MSSIPIMLVVTPNYNHWIFIHFVVLGFITIGINEIFISKKVQLAIVMSYAILFLNFSSIYFYKYFSKLCKCKYNTHGRSLYRRFWRM